MPSDRPLPSTLATTKVVVGTNPAAGAEIAVTVPAGKWWSLQAIRFALVTSAAVVNRRPALTIDDGTTVYWQWRVGVDQAASLTRSYQFLRSLTTEVDRSATFNELYEPLDEDLFLTPGSVIRTTTNAKDAGDDYGAPTLYVVEYG